MMPANNAQASSLPLYVGPDPRWGPILGLPYDFDRAVPGDLPIGAGNIYYVNGNTGSETYNGLTAHEPKLLLQSAIDLCTANHDDVVIVQGYGATAGALEAWPVEVNKSKVHIIGTPAQAAPSPYLAAVGNFACLLISASNVEVAGLEFGAGAAHGCIETSGLVWKGHIHDNFFAWQGGGLYGIWLSKAAEAADCPSWWIHDNKFGANLTDHNIYIGHNSTRTVIENNVFLAVITGKSGICVENTMAYGIIRNNLFKVADAATGEAIYFHATAVDNAIIDGNVALQGVVAMGLNPYRDLGANHWGDNVYSITHSLPVTV